MRAHWAFILDEIIKKPPTLPDGVYTEGEMKAYLNGYLAALEAIVDAFSAEPEKEESMQ